MTKKYSADDDDAIKEIRMLPSTFVHNGMRHVLVTEALNTKRALYEARSFLLKQSRRCGKRRVFECNKAYLEAMRRLEEFDTRIKTMLAELEHNHD